MPPKLRLSLGGIRAPIYNTVPWAHRSPIPKRHREWFSCFVELTVVNNRHTHRHAHRRRYICSNRSHLCTPCMRCGLIIRSELAEHQPSKFRRSQSSRDADARDHWTRRVTGSTYCRSVQISSDQFVRSGHSHWKADVQNSSWRTL